jgi:diguanylate cyclase (GGDEF)-like protein
VCSVDADGMLTAVSGAALTAAGVCCEEAVGEHLGTGLAPVPVLANLLRGPTAASPATTRSTSGRRRSASPCARSPRRLPPLGYDLSEQQAAEARVRLLEHNDALTGLPNRRSVTEVLDDAADRAQRNAAVALLRVRFDDLDVAAGALGVAAADGLLAETAERIRAAAPERAFVARGDGPELMVVLTGLPRDGRAAAEEVAQSLLGALVAPTVAGGRPIRLAPAIGGALAPRDGSTAADLLRAAASAQLRAREDGPERSPSRPASRVRRRTACC